MTTPSVPNSTRRARPENPVEEVVETVEEIFLPKPGGMIDNWHKEKARREAAQREAENSAEKVTESAAYTVKVAQLQPEIFATNVVNIANGGQGQVLPYSRNRYRATIVASVACILSKDQSQALGGIGFPLPANTPIVVNARAQLWASATTGATVISILSEMYAENG